MLPRQLLSHIETLAVNGLREILFGHNGLEYRIKYRAFATTHMWECWIEGTAVANASAMTCREAVEKAMRSYTKRFQRVARMMED